MLLCQKLDSNATLPTISHPGEDLGYDLYSAENVVIPAGEVVAIRSGVAARFVHRKDSELYPLKSYGLLYRDRSSMAKKGITVIAGVIDAGFTGELKALLLNTTKEPYEIKIGDKMIQMIPTKIIADEAKWVEILPNSDRGGKEFGSSGR